MEIIRFLLSGKMNIRTFLLWVWAFIAGCLTLGILFQIYRAARSIADCAPQLVEMAIR